MIDSAAKQSKIVKNEKDLGEAYAVLILAVGK